MTVGQLPEQVLEFARYLNGLVGRLDRGGGWCEVFWQRDPDGMRACLEGREVPPWDVVEALLQDVFARYGERAAAQETTRARTLYEGSLAAYDARPGGRDALGDRLDVMLREQRYAAERQVGLSGRLASAVSREEAEAIRVDLAWAQDDHERATARCAELRHRIDHVDRHALRARARSVPGLPAPAAPDGTWGWRPENRTETDPPGGRLPERHPSEGGGRDGYPSPGHPLAGNASAGDSSEGDSSGAGGVHHGHDTSAPGVRSDARPRTRAGAPDTAPPPADHAADPGHAPAPAPGSVPVPGQAAVPGHVFGHAPGSGSVPGQAAGPGPASGSAVGPGSDPGLGRAAGPGSGHALGQAPVPGHASGPGPAAGYPVGPDLAPGPGPGPALGHIAGPGAGAGPDSRQADEPWPPPASRAPGDAWAHDPAAGPAPAHDRTPPGAGPSPEKRAKRRRRGSARFAGMAEPDTAPAAVPQTGPALPAPPAQGRRTPRGARFAGAAEEPARPPAEAATVAEPGPPDADARRLAAEAVATLTRLRSEGRSGEAHALLVEVAYWPPARFPLLAAELHDAGLDADWATLLWEAASLPAGRLVAAADALTTAGRTADGRQMLRQGVTRPAPEIGAAVLGLADEGRGREIGALLDAYVRVCAPEEAARSVEADPERLVPLLLRAARGVSDECQWDLVHALRVAGFTA
ncbi:hypothetical protein [Streptomyces sp. NPDC058751]|uniref:hypothetical protein n=1 Tax=Streptomyces sp. NPDC058751 TaxID=3346623 RepID=UPI0036A07326